MKIATSLAQAKGIAEGAKANGTRFLAQMAALQAGITRKQQEITQGLSIAGLDAKAIEAQVATSMKNHLKAVRVETEKARYDIFKEIDAANQALSYMRSEMTEPRRVATSFMFGTNERALVESQAEKLGLGGLASLAKKAAATSHTPEGKLLAAVCAEACSRVKPNSRPFDPFELSEQAFGAECEQVKAHCKETQLQFDKVRALNRSFETGQPLDSTEKIRLGLENPGIDVLPTDEAPEAKDTGFTSSTDKIAASLKALDEYRNRPQPTFEESWAAALKEAEAA